MSLPKSPPGSPLFSEKNSVWEGFFHQSPVGNSVTCAQELQKSVSTTGGLWLVQLSAACFPGSRHSTFQGDCGSKVLAFKTVVLCSGFREREKCQYRQIQVWESSVPPAHMSLCHLFRPVPRAQLPQPLAEHISPGLSSVYLPICFHFFFFFSLSGHSAQTRCSIKVCGPNGWQMWNDSKYESAKTAWGKQLVAPLFISCLFSIPPFSSFLHGKPWELQVSILLRHTLHRAKRTNLNCTVW